MRRADEFPARRLGERMAQQALGRHDYQRLAEGPVHLAAQNVEVIGRAGNVAHLHIVLGAELEIALEPRRGMLGPLPFVAMRQQQHEAIGAQPL